MEMQRFTAKIVDLMKEENLYASQGGPIILSQIENEYGNIQSAYGPAAKTYVNWAAQMATSLDTGVPWVMSKQSDTPDPLMSSSNSAYMINTCNGFYCDSFTPNSTKKPKMWTENWTGWFLSFGGVVPYRPVEDIAFAVPRFYQLGDYDTLRALDSDNVPSTSSMSEEEINALPVHKYKVAGLKATSAAVETTASTTRCAVCM